MEAPIANLFDVLLGSTNDGDAWALSLPNIGGEGQERHVAARVHTRLEKFAQRRDEPGHGVFFCVSTIAQGQPRKKENARQLPFLFADTDFKHIDRSPEQILAVLQGLPYPPSRVHFTGNGLHCFWYLTAPVEAEGFERAEALLKRIAYLLGADIQVCRRVALLRVPNTHNTKRNERKLVTTIRETAAAYDLDDLERWLTSATVPVIAKRGAESNPFLQLAETQAVRAPVDAQQRLKDMCFGGGDINGVHPTQLAVSGSLTSKGMDEDEIVEIILNATKELDGTGDWNWFEEERSIRRMCGDMRKKIEKKKELERQPRSLSAGVPTASLKDARKSREDEMADEVAPAYSDEALALRFTARYPNLRYTAKWGEWSIFDGKRWKPDDTRAVFSCARIVCREAAREVNATTLAKGIASSKTRSAAVSMASDDRRVAATVDQWDTDPWLLNTPAGTVDLRDGTTRDHRAEDYMTKITAVSPDASCPTPLFIRFLDTVTRANEQYELFFQRVCGYCLTGLTRDHAMFFIHGDGGNGKGVLMGTIIDILADYHHASPIETFTDNRNERHSTEVAMLRGTRLVTVTETEEGKGWAESRIKELTGGDNATARFMRQDFFEYVPQFKLMISGNHKPGLKSVDAAIRRRFHLLPFTVTISPEQRDVDLREKLKAEWPGILAWMVKGCLEWQERGLVPPEVVTSATDSYLEDQDTIGRWVDEYCARDPNAFTLIGDLYAAWEGWADAMGEYKSNSKRFSQRLEAMGFVRENRRHQGGRGFRGVELVPSARFATHTTGPRV